MPKNNFFYNLLYTLKRKAGYILSWLFNHFDEESDQTKKTEREMDRVILKIKLMKSYYHVIFLF